MQEIHEGDCENRLGGRFLGHKVINLGYYWLKMFDDAKGLCEEVHVMSEVSSSVKHAEY